MFIPSEYIHTPIYQDLVRFIDDLIPQYKHYADGIMQMTVADLSWCDSQQLTVKYLRFMGMIKELDNYIDTIKEIFEQLFFEWNRELEWPMRHRLDQDEFRDNSINKLKKDIEPQLNELMAERVAIYQETELENMGIYFFQDNQTGEHSHG